MKLLVLSFFLLFSFALQGQTQYSPREIKRLSNIPVKINFNGEVYTSHFSTGLKKDAKIIEPQGPDAYSSISYVRLSNLRNYYDLESNGTPLQIWQDPSNPNNLHAIYMYSSQETGWSDRTMQYFWSSDKGATWTFIGNVPAAGRAGFGSITGASTGVALICAHTNTGISTNIRTQIYVDAFPGLGSFTALDPGGENNKYMWPKIVTTQNTSLTNKFVFTCSTSGADSAFYGIGTSLSSSQFLPYRNYAASPAECYTIARGSDGRIGIAYVIDDARYPTDIGDVFYMESTNAGSNFSTPVKIFDANFSGDSLGGLRGISMVYKNTVPCVVFETIKQNTTGSFFPGAPNNIRFWSPAVNSGNSIILADSNKIPYAPYQGTNDVLAPLCRPSIGLSADGTMLFTSIMVSSSATGGTDTTSFGEIYLTRSSNGGANWITPERITPTAPRNDWKYASISPYNDNDGSNFYVNIIVQKDTVPGSNVNLANPNTYARPYFIRVAYPRVVTPPAVPTLLAPANNAVNQSITPTLSWTTTGESYRVQVSTNSGFTNIILDQNNVSTASYQIPNPYLTQNTTYYWRVAANSPGGTSSFSSAFAFTTTNATIPAAPTLITPANGATGVSVNPAFDWFDVAGATSFRLQISLSNSFSTILYDTSNVTLSQLNLPLSLSNNVLYYWRVCATNAAGSGSFSTPFSFTTVLAAPTAPSLISPANGALGITLTPNMVWNSASGATNYNLVIATDLNFNNVVYNINTSSTNHSVAPGTLQLNTLYFWRVRGSNTGGNGNYSSTWNFRSTTVNINSIAGAIPTEYKLFNNYPNPFNPETKIKFDLPKYSNVSIKIYDMTGKMVSDALNFTLDAGTYETPFNASTLSSGVYYFRIETGNFTDTKKMILVK